MPNDSRRRTETGIVSNQHKSIVRIRGNEHRLLEVNEADNNILTKGLLSEQDERGIT